MNLGSFLGGFVAGTFLSSSTTAAQPVTRRAVSTNLRPKTSVDFFVSFLMLIIFSAICYAGYTYTTSNPTKLVEESLIYGPLTFLSSMTEWGVIIVGAIFFLSSLIHLVSGILLLIKEKKMIGHSSKGNEHV